MRVWPAVRRRGWCAEQSGSVRRAKHAASPATGDERRRPPGTGTTATGASGPTDAPKILGSCGRRRGEGGRRHDGRVGVSVDLRRRLRCPVSCSRVTPTRRRR